MAFLLKGLFGIGGSQAQVAAQAQEVKNGDLVIQLDAEHGQIIFGALESKTINPMIFDLKSGIIHNAAFPPPEVVDTSPPPL
jgi:hypothetical protein